MTLKASGNLQGAGRVDVQFRVPLDAPEFDMTFQGTLGAMPATALNSFIEEVLPLRIARGDLVEIGFRARVQRGVARGTITPRFNDLSLSVTERGSEGILGGSGFVGGVARSLVSFAANRWMVRTNNPANAVTPARTGTIRHRFSPDETLHGFLWASVRDGLLQVVSK